MALRRVEGRAAATPAGSSAHAMDSMVGLFDSQGFAPRAPGDGKTNKTEQMNKLVSQHFYPEKVIILVIFLGRHSAPVDQPE